MIKGNGYELKAEKTSLLPMLPFQSFRLKSHTLWVHKKKNNLGYA